jgi:SNF2 family DNA or RNA helicase
MMPGRGLECSVDGSRLNISGPALAVQALRSALSSQIGGSNVDAIGGKSLCIEADLIDAAAETLAAHGISHPVIDQALLRRRVVEAARLEALAAAETGDGSSLPEKWRNTLEKKQAAAVEAMLVDGLPGFCLFDEQGSGKTVMMLAVLDILCAQKRIDFALIVAPKSMCREWADTFEKFVPGEYAIQVVDGSREERSAAILGRANVLIVNFEQLAAHEVFLKAACKSRRAAFVADESFYLKNPNAQRSEAALRIRSLCAVGYVLCGTPAPNAPADIVHQFNLADNGFTFSGYRPTGEASVDLPVISFLLSDRGIFIRRLKEEILSHVPEKRFKIHGAVMQGRQREIYDKAERDLLVELRSFDNKVFRKRLSYYLQRREALLQICACPSSIDPLFQGSSAKLAVLETLADQILSHPERKVVVWSFYKAGLDVAERLLSKYGTVRVDGTVGAEQRRIAIRSFQESPNTRVFIGNPAAAGAGITLHAAADAIYFSYPKQAAHHLQSIDRIHRRGQKANETTYHLIVCESTVEESVVAQLRDKELRQADLLGDVTPWPADLDQAIQELSRKQQT